MQYSCVIERGHHWKNLVLTSPLGFLSTQGNKCIFVVSVNAFARCAKPKMQSICTTSMYLLRQIGRLKNKEQLTCKSVWRISLRACWHSRRQSALNRVNGSPIEDLFHATRMSTKHQNGAKTTHPFWRHGIPSAWRSKGAVILWDKMLRDATFHGSQNYLLFCISTDSCWISDCLENDLWLHE